MNRLSLIEAAVDHDVPTERLGELLDEAERRAAARRFASFQDHEVSAMLIAARVTLGRRRGLSADSWCALAGVSRELAVEVDARLAAASRRSARQDGVS